ncbi:hypothetical protein ETD83_16350 [Actinomadura soli]|uniref:Uncharacterized protein n=1 Tax=Actinomadura soli TaxID=2508997 RepID=A0A5C4JC39_9ACTN|nr:hypothetical protein [Actinomadura soli]TMR00620.1 hypothetical protein ETD83_16350 [Actinomadura soli]
MTVAIATALAGKAVEVASEPVRAAVAEISRRVRERLHGRPSDEEALARADDDPEILQGAVLRLFDEDPGFRADAENLWNQAQTMASASDDGVVNIFNGQAQRVIQARDIKGDLNLG